MVKKNIFIGLGVSAILSFFIILATSSSDDKNSEWHGKYKGVCPSYNMTDKNGEPLVFNGNYAEVPAVEYIFEIFKNNKCNITIADPSSAYFCRSVGYSVENNKLTMKPRSGSDCGGNEIVISKENNIYKIEKGLRGQPSYIVSKVE